MRLLTIGTVKIGCDNTKGSNIVSQMKRDLSPYSDEHLKQAIRLALNGIQFGSVEITVHNSKVVQVERIEKTSFEGAQPTPLDG